MRKEIIEAIRNTLESRIGWHIMNINLMMDNAVGVAEHPDTLQTVEEELEKVANYNDKLEVLNKYF